MDWTAIGAVGEIVGAAAVVITLGYLARQVRQANRIAKAEAYRAARVGFRELTEGWAESPEWLDLLTRIVTGRVRREDLTLQERTAALIRYQALLNLLAQIHHDVELGILPESAYDIVDGRSFETPYFSDIWPWVRQGFPRSFGAFIESRFSLEPSDSTERLPIGAD